MNKLNSRRRFIRNSLLAGGALVHPGNIYPIKYGKDSEREKENTGENRELIIDIHQHIFYHGRTDAQLIQHQKNMGVSQTVLLPAGSNVFTMSTHYGHSNGLRAGCGGNESCFSLANSNRKEYFFAANEVPDLPDAIKTIEKYLKLGAKMIAEVKFGVACDSLGMQKIYQLAAEYDVPVLMHWLHGELNYGFPRFYKMLEKYPETKFIGHAQTWWANIDKNQEDHPWEAYPKGPIALGGITDKYLTDYPNMYGDLSAGSGLNALSRDEEFTKVFFIRHQDKLLYGSDCADIEGTGDACTGAGMISLIRKLASEQVRKKLFSGNAQKLLKL